MVGRERGAVATATDGVTVRKRLESGGTAVAYEIDSQRAASVRLVEPIPTALESDELGFVGAEGDQPWSIQGPKIVFERSFEGGERIRTGMAARGEHADAIEVLLEAPEAIEVDPADGAASGVAERLLEELRVDAVPPETRAALRDELEVDGPRRSVETRLSQLQSDVADVRAYANAMEGFLDAHGEAGDVLERVERRFERLEDELSAVRTDLESLDGELERVEKDVDRRLEDVEDQLAAVADFAATLKGAFGE